MREIKQIKQIKQNKKNPAKIHSNTPPPLTPLPLPAPSIALFKLDPQ